MASYKYEVVGADGKPKTGTIEAMNMEVASAELKSGGTIVTSQRLVLCVPDDVADDSCLVCKEGV